MGLAYYHFFFFNDTATTEIYTLSLHDALPILDDVLGLVAGPLHVLLAFGQGRTDGVHAGHELAEGDRKSTRLNSSHTVISYAVFCLKKKNKISIKTYNRQRMYNTTSSPHESVH